MKRALRTTLAMVTLGVAGVVGLGSLSSAAGAQELDLCALLGDPYCPPGQDGGAAGEGVGAGGLARTGTDTGPLAGIGVGLVAAGGTAAYAARRRASAIKTPAHLA